jgi:choline-sulfatase
MLRRGRYKLVCSLDEPSELYDIEADPGEVRNLASDPAHREAFRGLTASLFRRWHPRQLDRRIRQSQRERRLIYDSLFAYLPSSKPGKDMPFA